MDDLIMDTGYRFNSGKNAHRFLHEVYELDLDGVNFFIDDTRDPCGIVILRFRGQADITGLDRIASGLGGERMYLPGDWRMRFIDYEMTSIESF